MFKIETEDKGGARITLLERVWLTREGKIVPNGHPDAATLYCAPGKSVLRADYEARMPPEPEPEPKAKPSKAKPRASNKAKG